MTSKLERVIQAYEEQRARGHEIWDIYEGEPSVKGATEKSLERLRKKLGRALPKDYEAFLRKHDGWEGYEYDRTLLSTKEILDDVAAEVVEVNMDNMDEDEADKLENVFVIGTDNGSATLLYYDTTGGGEPVVVQHYVQEQGRWPSLTAYFEFLHDSLTNAIASELGTKAKALADWAPATRKTKEEAYHAKLAARWQPPPAKAPPIPESFGDLGGVPSDATELDKSQLRTYLGFSGYLLYLPTAAEVTAAALAFRRHFPWKGKVKACAPSNEYGAKEIAPDTTDFSPFLEVQSGGHFGLRMVDEAKGRTERIFNLRGAPASDDEPVAPFLEVLVPADADPKALRAFVLDLAQELPLAHGIAGYIALPSNAKWREHMKILHGWCRAHWGLEIALADELIPLALHGVLGASWLTLLDNPTGALVRKHLPKRDVRVHERKHAIVIEAGDAPSLGDVRVAFPRTVAAVHNVLAPLMAPGIGELRHFDDQGGTAAWWHRFEDPAGFAVGATNLFTTIKAAFDAGDAKQLRASMTQLEARPPELQASLHQQLSDLAYGALEKKHALAIILYDYLTAVKNTNSANLCNALLACLRLGAAADKANPEIADRFLARGLPSGKENPNIFYNAMCVHALRGDVDRAAATLKTAAPHFTVALSKLIDSDADLAPARANAKFAAVHRAINKRLGIGDEWPPLARNAELEAKVGAQSGSAATYRQYAKWLTKAGDPRGALIEAQMAEEKTPRSKEARAALKKLITPYIRNRLQARYPDLAAYFKVEDFHWGVLHRIYFNGWEKRHHGAGYALLSDPECLFLETVYMHDMTIDLTELATKIPYVRSLELTRTKFPKLESLDRFEHLESLSLNQTTVTDLTPLRGLKRLRRLSLNGTPVTDLRPVAAIKTLDFVSLEGAAVESIEPLFDLPLLSELWLYKTKVPEAQAKRMEDLIRARQRPGGHGTGIVYGP